MFAVTASVSAGCNRTSAPSLPEFPVEPAEADFERVTQRLESALADAQPAAGSGIVSRRECRYRLIPPSSAEDDYEAEVTIETTVRLLKPNIPARPQPKAAADSPEEIIAAAQAADKLAAPTPREVAEQEAAKIVESSETRSEETYRLTYKNDRWRLVEPPEEPIERLVLEYALRY